jgi:conjugative transposon TraK protein
MLIKNIENKFKLTFTISIASLLTSIIIVVFVLSYSFRLLREERQNIYVLDAGIPMLVQRSTLEENEEVEGMSHVNMFHSLFFNLPPDDRFITNNIIRATYLIDESGIKLYNDFKERGIYNQIIANSILFSIKSDSIIYDTHSAKFRYVGTQRIERTTSVTYRSFVAEGYLKRSRRSETNPHGFVIFDYKIIENEDIETRLKRRAL